MADDYVHLELNRIDFSGGGDKPSIAHVHLNAVRLGGKSPSTLTLSFDVPNYESLDEAVGTAREQLQAFAKALLDASQRPLLQKKRVP